MRPHLLKHGAIPWVDEMLSNLPQQEPNEDFINYLTRLNKCGRELFQKLERELVAVTEQRDKALQKIKNQAERIAYLEGATNHATGTPLSKAIEQRDRLETILKECLYEMPCGYVPNHTIEKLPHMIANQTQLFAEEITHSEKLEKQRDRLVDALELIENRYIDGADSYDDMRFMGKTASEALQSLTTKTNESI